jgi:hypothetical protein
MSYNNGIYIVQALRQMLNVYRCSKVYYVMQ